MSKFRNNNEPTKRVIIPKGLVDPNETTIIEIPSNYSREEFVLATPKLRDVASETYHRPSTTRIRTNNVNHFSGMASNPYYAASCPPNVAENLQYNYDQATSYNARGFVNMNAFLGRIPPPLFEEPYQPNMTCEFINPEYNDTSDSTNPFFSERMSISTSTSNFVGMPVPAKVVKKNRTVISPTATEESETTVIETVMRGGPLPNIDPLQQPRIPPDMPRQTMDQNFTTALPISPDQKALVNQDFDNPMGFAVGQYQAHPRFTHKTIPQGPLDLKTRQEAHADQIYSSVEEKLSKIEAEERVMLEMDLLKYQNARRQLLQDTAKIDTSI